MARNGIPLGRSSIVCETHMSGNGPFHLVMCQSAVVLPQALEAAGHSGSDSRPLLTGELTVTAGGRP